jgi:hypothetical protein
MNGLISPECLLSISAFNSEISMNVKSVDRLTLRCSIRKVLKKYDKIKVFDCGIFQPVALLQAILR